MTLPRRVLALCLLRAGPQDLPYSPRLTAMLVGLVLVLNLVYASVTGLDHIARLLPLALAFLLLPPWLLLGLRGMRNRYAQTLAALAAVSIVYIVLFMPLASVVAAAPPPDPASPPELAQALVALGALALLSWKLMADASIYRHALELPMLAAVLLAIGLFALELGTVQAVARALE